MIKNYKKNCSFLPNCIPGVYGLSNYRYQLQNDVKNELLKYYPNKSHDIKKYHPKTLKYLNYNALCKIAQTQSHFFA